MRAFAELLDRLYFSHGNLAKAAILHDYFRHTPDPDRGWAVAAISGELRFDLFKRTLVRDLVAERTDPALFAMSYDYVGEMSETVAHLWPTPPARPVPGNCRLSMRSSRRFVPVPNRKYASSLRICSIFPLRRSAGRC